MSGIRLVIALPQRRSPGAAVRLSISYGGLSAAQGSGLPRSGCSWAPRRCVTKALLPSRHGEDLLHPNTRMRTVVTDSECS